MNARNCLLIASFCILLAACSNDPQKKVVTTGAGNPAPSLTAPFRFHKSIEVSPGETYDILSWGRGATVVGAFMILHSDSANSKYITTTGDLNGAITDVYNADMDTDGNPEILIQTKVKDTVNYAEIYAYEFNNSNANKLDFPKLTNSQRKGYRGNDNFYIKDGKLIREFPIYASNDSLAKPTGAKRQLEYGLSRNEFTVTQLSKDSTDVKTSAAPAKQALQQTDKQSSSKKSAKKKNAEVKRKHRRRRS